MWAVFFYSSCLACLPCLPPLPWGGNFIHSAPSGFWNDLCELFWYWMLIAELCFDWLEAAHWSFTSNNTLHLVGKQLCTLYSHPSRPSHVPCPPPAALQYDFCRNEVNLSTRGNYTGCALCEWAVTIYGPLSYVLMFSHNFVALVITLHMVTPMKGGEKKETKLVVWLLITPPTHTNSLLQTIAVSEPLK